MSSCSTTPCLENGTILSGKWEIIEHIATGGKGEVYRARQTTLARDVVVKIISREYLADLEGDEDYIRTELERFHREALAMASIRHPYIVQVYDQDEASVVANGIELSAQYLVMEYIDGPSLRSTMPSEGFCTNEHQARQWIRAYFLPVLDGIQAVHDLGIVHRDVKPENVLLQNDTPKIMDFGLAGGARWSGLTKSHHVEGTITYMAPEQFMDLGETDARGDVYALGKILYEAVIGKMDKKTAFPLKGVSLPCPDTPFFRRLDLIIRKATAEDKEQRAPSVMVFKEQLEKLLDDFDACKLHILGLTVSRPSRKPIVAATTLVVVLIIITNLAHHVIMVREEHGHAPVGLSRDLPHGKSPAGGAEQRASTSPGSQLIGIDGSTLRFVPGGQFTLPSMTLTGPEKSFRVAPVYVGETEVTNAQYVKFLNQVLSRITVVNGSAKSDSSVWLVLGQVFGGYEPIAFQNGRFSVKEPRFDEYPVIRVTAHGAQAYARFYGYRLPTEFEWYAAALADKSAPGHGHNNTTESSEPQSDLEREMSGLVDAYGLLDKVGPDISDYASEPSRVPYNVSKFPPNTYRIRGLNANIGEWGLRGFTESEQHDLAPKYVILGEMDGTWLLGSTLIRGPEQNPSEALPWVGLRIAKDLSTPRQGE